MPTKLIEVALPLAAINTASAKEKSIRHGHPSSLHLWWARRPLATCRAVLFASLVDDPSAHPEVFKTEAEQDTERERLFDIIRDLVEWENSGSPTVLAAARAEIQKSCRGVLPPVLDPFAGGGSIPLEAQRLGLEAHASDLNPVAVLINKALIEIPPKFSGQAPVNPDARRAIQTEWERATGLAEDIRWYGEWMRTEAMKRIGHLYPKVKLPREHGGGEATVIAWMWARTVQCPHPDCRGTMPLVKSFLLSTKKNRKAWIEYTVDAVAKTVTFSVRTGQGTVQTPPKTGRGAKFICLVCKKPVVDQHIKDEGAAKRMGAQLMAVVAEGPRGRTFISPTAEDERVALTAKPEWKPEQPLADDPRNLWCIPYGMKTFADLFTARQLATLSTFCDVVAEVRELALTHARAAGLPEEAKQLADCGRGATAYADAIAVYLGFSISKAADYNCTLVTWINQRDQAGHAFSKQAIPMVWDFVEVNPLAQAAGDPTVSLAGISRCVAQLVAGGVGHVKQQNAIDSVNGIEQRPVISTDPPYYDNIGYADLSDFFYVWLRHSLSSVFPGTLNLIVTPKREELIASPYRHGGDKDKAKQFFEDNLGKVFANMRHPHHPDYPLTVYYAFKQAETDEDEAEGEDVKGPTTLRSSTGWETMLEGLIRAEFQITGTWPMRTERAARSIGMGTNALASSVVLVCRPRPANVKPATRREFIGALKRELPDALKKLQHGNIAPVDLSQAAIGPGMAVFSRYKQVLESRGEPMTVRTALQLINQALDEVLSEQDSEYDAHTRFTVAWFEQYALGDGPFGDADVMARAKDCALNGLVQAGVLSSRAGKVRLLKRDELATDWSPTGRQPYAWEVTQHLIRALEKEGEAGAAAVLREIGGLGEIARDLAYRLYNTCEKKKWTDEARAYNSLVIAWPEVLRLSRQQPSLPKGKAKPSLFEDTDDE